MNRIGWVLFAFSVGFFALSVFTPESSSTHTVERIKDGVRTIERFDDQGVRHGLQEAWVDGVLSHERMVEHGQVLWRKEYDPDCSVKEHWVENESHLLVPVKE